MAAESEISKWEKASDANKAALDLIDPNRKFVFRYSTFSDFGKLYQSDYDFLQQHKISVQKGAMVFPLLQQLQPHWNCGSEASEGGGGNVITIDSIEDIEKILPSLIDEHLKVGKTRFSGAFRDKKTRKDSKKCISSRVCQYRLPFNAFDGTRENLIKLVCFRYNIDSKLFLAREHKTGDEKENSKENDKEIAPKQKIEKRGKKGGSDRFGPIAITGGSGCGKSHMIDYIVNEIGAHSDVKRKYLFIPIPFNDCMKLATNSERKWVKDENYEALIGLRLIFMYFIEIKSHNGGVAFLENVKDLYGKYATQLCDSAKYKCNWAHIIFDIKKEIESTGREMIFCIDDAVAATKIEKERKLIWATTLYGEVIFSTTELEHATRVLTNSFISVCYLKPLNLSKNIEYALQQGNDAMIEEKNEKNGKNEKGIELGESGKFLLKLLGDHARSFGVFYYAIWNDEKFLKYCIGNDYDSLKNGLNCYIEMWKSGTYGPTDGYRNVWRSEPYGSTAYGAVIAAMILGVVNDKLDWKEFSNDTDWIEYFYMCGMLYYGMGGHTVVPPILLYVFADDIKNGYVKEVDPTLVNIASYFSNIFDIISGDWGGKPVEALIGEMIGLKINCAVFLLDYDMIKFTDKSLTLGNFFKFRVFKKANNKNYGECHDDADSVSSEWFIDFAKIGRKHLGSIEVFDKTSDDIGKLLNQVQDGVASYKSNNKSKSFDYHVCVPIMRGAEKGIDKLGSLHLFCEAKSRGDCDIDEKAVSIVPYQKQFVAFSDHMKKFKRNASQYIEYSVFCDFPLLTNVNVRQGFDCVEQATFTLCGEQFGKYLKDFVLARQCWKDLIEKQGDNENENENENEMKN